MPKLVDEAAGSDAAGRDTEQTENPLKNRLEQWAEGAFYPDIPKEPLDLADLEKLDIPDLYKILNEMVDEDTSLLQLIRDSARCQIAFAYQMAGAIVGVIGKNQKEAREEVKEHEESFFETLNAAGLKVDYESEVSPEELARKTCLILATHQGGGFENYLHKAVLGLPCGIVAKGELRKIPFVRYGLEQQGTIFVDRAKTNPHVPEKRQEEINRISGEVVERLMAGENMLVFFEGTRSENGEIARTHNRRKWATDLLAAIYRAWVKKKGNGAGEQSDHGEADPEAMQTTRAKDFQTLLLVFNTMAAMPDAPEEKIFGTRFRLGAKLGARLVRADDLKVEESADPYDTGTLFGKARSVLKEMLIDTILEHQDMEDAF